MESEDSDEYPDGSDPTHAQGVQFGDHNQQTNVFVHMVRAPRMPVALPHQAGIVPPLADCYQSRDATARLAATAAEDGTAALCLVLAGLGGVGKTQLAAAYARQVLDRREIDLVVWVTASSPSAVKECYADALLDVTGLDEGNTERAARRFREWLAATGRRWLVVLDDVKSPGDLTGLWPPAATRGTTIITTRRRDSSMTRRGKLLDVDVFTPDEACAYLAAKLADRPDLADDLVGLAKDLGYLPLALAQAATYLLDRGRKVSEYRDRFADIRIRLSELVPERDALPDDDQATLAATWTISMELADQIPPKRLSGPLLALASVLDPDGIPEAVFSTDAARTFLTDHRTVDDGPVAAAQARDGLHCLHRLSLVHFDVGGVMGSVRVHPLVQRTTRDMQATAHSIASVVRAAAAAVTQAWPDVDSDTALAQRLRANARSLAGAYPDVLWDANVGCRELLIRAGNSLGETGLVTDAVEHFRKLCATSTHLLGADHPDTLTIRASLASWRGHGGDFAGAAAAFEELLVDRLRVLGPDDPATLTTRASLASYRGRAGDRAGAAAAFEELLVDRLRVLGPDDPATLTTRARLASWRGRDDPAGAIAAFEELLVDRLRVLGPDDPDTLITRASIASWRGTAGDPAGAAAALEDLLNDALRVFGPDHPATLTTRASLASYRGQTGNRAAAVAMFEELLEDRVRVLGPDHPATLATRGALVHWWAATGEAGRAEEEAQQLLADQTRVLGSGHPSTLATRGKYVFKLGSRVKSPSALAALRRLLAAQQTTLGGDHRETLVTRALVASLVGRLGDRAEAIEQLQNVLSDRLRTLGADHADVLVARASLAGWLGLTGDNTGAAEESQRLLRDQQRILGPDHPRTVTTLANVAMYCRRAGDEIGTNAALRQVLAAQMRTVGADDPKTLTTRVSLATWRRRVGDVAGAVEDLRQLLAEQRKHLGPDHADTAKTEATLAAWRARPRRRKPASSKERSQRPHNPQRTEPADAAKDDPAVPSTLAGLDAILDGDDPRRSASTAALLEALALAGGRGVPRTDGVWAAMANAIAGSTTIRDTDIDALLTDAAQYLVVDVEEDQAVYRLAHPGCARYLIDRAATTMGIDVTAGVALWQQCLVKVLTTQFSTSSYLIRNLARHVAEAGCWADLARRPHILDRLNPDAVTEQVLRYAFGVVELPSEITTVARLRPLLSVLTPEDRAVVRGMATDRRTDYEPTDNQTRRGFWTLRWAVQALDPRHVTLTGLSSARSKVRDNPDALLAMAVVNRPGGPALLAAGDRTGIVRLWDAGTGRATGNTIDTGEAISALCTIPVSDGRVLLATGGNSAVQLWNPLTGRSAGESIDGQGGRVGAATAVQMLDGRTLLAIAADHGIVQLWDPLCGSRVGRPMAGHQGPVFGIATLRHRDGWSLLATVGNDGTLRLWDAETQQQHGPAMKGHAGAIHAVTTVRGKDGRQLVATGGHDGTVRLWSPITNRSVGKVMIGQNSPVRAVTGLRLPDGRNVIAGGGDDRVTLLWDAYTGSSLSGQLAGHTARIHDIVAVPASTAAGDKRTLLATCSHDGSVRLWDLTDFSRRPDTDARLRSNVCALTAIETDGDQILLAAGYADGTVRQRDHNGAQLKKAFTAHTSRILALAAFHLPHGEWRLITLGDDHGLKFWDSAGRSVGQLAGGGAAARLLAPIAVGDGTVLAASVASDGSISLWDPARGERLSTFASGHAGPVRSITGLRRRDGVGLLATGGQDRTIRLWDPTTGESVGTPLTESCNTVHAMTAVTTPTGEALLAASGNENKGKIVLWDPMTGRAEASLTIEHGDSLIATLTTVRAQDGRQLLVSAGRNRTVRIWDPVSGRMLHRLDVEGPITACHGIGRWLAIGTERGISLLELGDTGELDGALPSLLALP
jgi:WD40 repeat protein